MQQVVRFNETIHKAETLHVSVQLTSPLFHFIDMAKSNKDSFLRRCRKDIRSQRRAIWKREITHL
ncbi:hypothetical protein RhiirC2_796665 [Rhizophagus irregularis]|uniref:Uncharacterized protein n=1 Tax=Rhizophagus irregularis TaxID=588596 RepID=A0A2N1M9A5_9GLOM|nr:hypothetical protein RhiirC2_796665 [Rhizophagus irregularis]